MKSERLFFTSLFLIIFLSIPCKAQEVNSNILQRVFLIKYGQELGSSFTIDVQNRQYLITARHIVKGIKDGDTIDIFHDNQWKSIKVKPLYTEPGEVDIVVLVLPIQISPSHPLDVSPRGLFVSQSTYFLGFPYGLNMEGKTLNNGYPLPFVKQGICPAFYFSPNNYTVVLIDGINNPGFSGGPVVYVDQVTKKLTVAAVVSAYRNQEDKIFRKVKPKANKNTKTKPSEEKLVETDMIVKSNAGLIISYHIKSALDVISKNPIGPIISQ